MKTALLFLFACTLSFSQITRSGGGRPKACVGSPGNTNGIVGELCHNAGVVYSCAQSGGCTLAAHWRKQVSEDASGNVSISTTDPGQGAIATASGVWSADQGAFMRPFLRDWNAALAKLTIEGSTGKAGIAFLGDSITVNDRVTGPIRQKLQTMYGNSGIGWVSLAGLEAQSGVSITTAGTWTTRNKAAGAAGLNCTDATSSDTATPARKTIAISTGVTDWYVHYLVKPGGGTFTWAVDGGGATTVSTDGATQNTGIVSITGLSNAAHTVVLTVTDAGSTGVTLLGIDSRINVPGVVLHKIASSGSRAADFAAVDATTWRTALAGVAPNIVCIMLGVNDAANIDTPSGFKANLQTMIANIQAAVPLADILLIAQSDMTSPTGPYTYRQYVDAMRDLALASSYGFVDSDKPIGPWPQANARGLYADAVHPSTVGGQLIANHIMSYLLPPDAGSYSTAAVGSVQHTVLAADSGASTGIASFTRFKTITNPPENGSTLRFGGVNFIGTMNAYLQWTKTSNLGRTFQLITANAAGTSKTPYSTYEDGASYIPGLLFSGINPVDADYNYGACNLHLTDNTTVRLRCKGGDGTFRTTTFTIAP
jgi:lysophospholipase L1-like esterase